MEIQHTKPLIFVYRSNAEPSWMSEWFENKAYRHYYKDYTSDSDAKFEHHFPFLKDLPNLAFKVLEPQSKSKSKKNKKKNKKKPNNIKANPLDLKGTLCLQYADFNIAFPTDRDSSENYCQFMLNLLNTGLKINATSFAPAFWD
jgi:hypothetical protein